MAYNTTNKDLDIDSGGNSPKKIYRDPSLPNGWAVYYLKNGDPWGGTNVGDGKGKGTKTVKARTLRLVYYKNGAEGDPPFESIQTELVTKETLKESKKLEDTVKDNDFHMEKDGYWLAGWATSSDGSVKYLPGDKIEYEWAPTKYGTQTYRFYAKWTSSGLFIYKPDENTIEEFYDRSVKKSGTETQLKGAIFTRIGYTQVGWADEEGGEKTHDLEETITPDSSSIQILYPVWQAKNYNITLHANGGVGEDVVVVATYDSEVTIPASTFTKNGYHQNGWNEEEDGYGSAWFSEREYAYVRAEDVDLYAVWEGDVYTVYYSEEAPGSQNYVHTSKAVYGSPFYTDRVPYPSGREYYSFNGWKADDNTVLTKQNAWYDAYSYGSDPTWTLQRDLWIYRQWSPTYPFGKMMFGGSYSDESGIYVEEPPEDTFPAYSYTHHEAFRKNGDILVDQGRFKNVERKYKISAYDGCDYASVSKKVSEWLYKTRSSEYIRLEDSYNPDVYRLAVYEESVSLENLLSKAGKAEITFNCKPQKFLNSGNKPIAVTQSGQIIHNPTSFAALPIIRLIGTGWISINGRYIYFLRNFNHITFDAETYDAYEDGGWLMNSVVYTEDSIVLEPGDNVITFEGVMSDIEITPRWWCV